MKAHPPQIDKDVRDLRNLLWSSIDNDTSRDLDQIEYAETVAAGIRVLIGIADVDTDVPIGSPIDIRIILPVVFRLKTITGS